MKNIPASSVLGGRPHPAQQWMADARVKTHPRGQTIIQAGTQHVEWIAISSGAACLVTRVAGSTRVAVATLWLGDVIGWGAPLGRLAAQYDVTALVDVVTIHIPWTRLFAPQQAFQPAAPPPQENPDTALLHAATELRLQEQIFMRLAGNGLQRLVSVLATLATALTSSQAPTRREHRLALPVAQACIGQLSGLSRRQTWIYLGQLADSGWVATSRTKVTLHGVHAWLGLRAEVDRLGLECITTVELCSAVLARLAGVHPAGSA